MAQTVEQIEAHIDGAREELGANLHELQRKVDAVTDWREHYQTKPFTLLTAAFVGGAVLGTALRGRIARGEGAPLATAPARHRSGTGRPTQQALEIWDHITQALIGVAATRLTDYVNTIVPGFNEQFQRIRNAPRSSGFTESARDVR
jgi:hypothetical protein